MSGNDYVTKVNFKDPGLEYYKNKNVYRIKDNVIFPIILIFVVLFTILGIFSLILTIKKRY